MMFSRQIKLGELAQLCRRLGTALEAGIDIRKVWQRETEGRGSTAVRSRMETVKEQIDRGETVSEAFAATDDFFPPLFHEMLTVGEQTGKLAEVFRQLANNYDQQIQMRRTFQGAIFLPMIQLIIAILAIGGLIWVMGMLPATRDGDMDILGFGLKGNSGVAIYFSFIAAIAAFIWVAVRAAGRGLRWVAPLQKGLVMIPGVGAPLKTLAVSRMAWALQVTTDTEMDLLKALPLSIRATGNAYYTEHIPEILDGIRRGNEISESLDAAGVFPRDFVDAIEVAERSGRMPESMKILAANYQDQAQAALRVLMIIAGWIVWAVIAMLIIYFIFRLASFYLGQITDLARPV